MIDEKIKIDALPEILTLKQACDILNCHPNTLRKWDANGVLKAMRFGTRKDRRYHKTDILHFLDKNSL